MLILFVLICAYLLGSIPFGYLIVRATSGSDVRRTGSGGTGATNVTRRAGRGAGALTLVLDAAKGAAAVLFALRMLGDQPPNDRWMAAAAVAAILGHCFPVWLGFRGGKGVATAIGIFTVLAPFALLLSGIIFFLLVVTTRYVSLGSVAAAISLPFFVWLVDGRLHPSPGFLPILVGSVAIATVVVFMHRENLARLRAGTENKFK